MKHAFVSRGSSSGAARLILFFAGWGMDYRPFSDLRRSGYDIIVAYDYRHLSFDDLPLCDYDEICVIGWSFGVVAAAQFIDSCRDRLTITRCVAVCGTLWPVDDRRGIPQAIFSGTLEGLCDRTLSKFYRRMCGTADAFRSFMDSAPCRDIDGLREELAAIAARGPFDGDADGLFDSVYIAASDNIIPTANQLTAWTGHPNISTIESSHMPPVNDIIERETVSKQLMAGHFSAGIATYDANAGAQHAIARRLLECLSEAVGVTSCLGRVLEIGVGTGSYTRMYLDRFSVDSLTLWDIAPGVGAGLPVPVDCVDAEMAISRVKPASFDVITSSSAMQWFNSPMRFLSHLYRALAPGGIAAISTFGPGTLCELRPYQHSALQYLDVEAIERMLHMAVTGVDDEVTVVSDIIQLTFADTRELISHLRFTGVNGGIRAAGMGAMRQLLSSGIRSLTYQPVYILVRKSR